MSSQNPVNLNKDPICGAAVDEAVALHVNRDGVTYYFCSEGCRKQFLSVPTNEETTRGPETAQLKVYQSVTLWTTY